jgi:DNA-binding cell septation regulator SpoVG
MLQIENYRQESPASSTAAYFDIHFPASRCTYRNFRIVRGKKGMFVAPPSFKKMMPDGSSTYVPYIEFSEEKGKEFMKKIYDALKELGYI